MAASSESVGAFRPGDELSLVDRLRAYVERWQLDLPLLPDAPRRVMELCDRETCDALALTELIHQDPAMAGHVLRVARSPLYATRVPVVSLRQAVSLLGLRAIREIALLIACQARVFKVRGHEEAVRDVFRHSLAAGFFAREIARLRRWNVEEAFLCGLLHDVGRPLLLQAAVDLSLHAEPGELERALDALHERVGAMLADHWELPEAVAQAMGMHHADPMAESTPRVAVQTALADALAGVALERPGADPQAVLEHPALQRLSLYPDDVRALLRRSEEAALMAKALS
jgi:putative nucleotidyltransferase with HDIG domain